MRLQFLFPLAVLPLLACTQADTVVTGPSGFLAGTWRTAPVPSGGGTVFILRAVSGSVSGTGQDYGLTGESEASSTVRGRYSGGAFQLTVEYQTGEIASYTGRLVDQDTLDGTWTPPAPQSAGPLRFFRQPD
jgi:hypothetical protein